MEQVTYQWQALTSMQQYQAVSASSDELSCQLANWPDQSLLSNVLGVILNNALAGQLVTVVLFGIIYDPNFNWIPKNPVYIGNGGYLTQTIPNTSVYQIGKAIGPHTLFVCPSPFLLLNL
jgi:hypothetical protein